MEPSPPTGPGRLAPPPEPPLSGDWVVGRWLLPPPPPRTAWTRWGRHLLLFLLTALSVFFGAVVFGGAVRVVALPGGGHALAIDYAQGLLQVGGLLGILLAHEMGHYLTARRHGVDATLPFFIPFPVSIFGTLGAFIRIRSLIPNRKALFDIGVAGPLAGFLVCLPVLWLGVLQARVVPSADMQDGALSLGEPLLFRWVAALVHGPIPAEATLVIGPLGLAAWFGLFVTALNLMPIGQLDGGHLTYALLRGRARRISTVASWVAVALAYFGPNWLIWAALVRILGRRHPSTFDDEAPVGRLRFWVGLLAAAVFAVCFVPDPIQFSWRQAFEALGLHRLTSR